MLYLGGGGSESDESKLWDLVFTPSSRRITLWPYAQPIDKHSSIIEWISSSLKPRGNFDVAIGTDLSNTDVLAIPGGNTFALLHYIRENNLDVAFQQYVKDGGRVYGGSAGALLLGADIAISDLNNGGEDENTVGLADTTALDLVGGYVVCPHMNDEKERERCGKWAVDKNVVVIGIPENGGVAVSRGGAAKSAGPRSVYVFKSEGQAAEYREGESWWLDARGHEGETAADEFEVPG